MHNHRTLNEQCYTAHSMPAPVVTCGDSYRNYREDAPLWTLKSTVLA
uniref:Uncharacterized protein n=1 Tax=Anguilla anguilla TaxID=7936 RepID=A0A0E9SKK3_ANGAN